MGQSRPGKDTPQCNGWVFVGEPACATGVLNHCLTPTPGLSMHPYGHEGDGAANLLTLVPNGHSLLLTGSSRHSRLPCNPWHCCVTHGAWMDDASLRAAAGACPPLRRSGRECAVQAGLHSAPQGSLRRAHRCRGDAGHLWTGRRTRAHSRGM